MTDLKSTDRTQPHAFGRNSNLPKNPKMTTQNVGRGGGNDSSSVDSPPTLPFPSADEVAQSELFKNTAFPSWRDDAGHDTTETPEELQKNDPLGTQIWKLYSRTKTRLPNQERMENLTWRMMAMNLKRREREQAL